MEKSTLVVLPVLINIVEVAVVESACQSLRSLVVELALAMELIVHPLSRIRQFFRLVEELPVPVHPVELPLSLVVPSILVVESAMAVSQTIQFGAFVSTALGKLLIDLHQLAIISIFRLICLPVKINRTASLHLFGKTYRYTLYLLIINTQGSRRLGTKKKGRLVHQSFILEGCLRGLLIQSASKGGSHVPWRESHRGQMRVKSDVVWTALYSRAAFRQIGVGRQETRINHAWARIIRLDIAAHLL
jgi:hypothetical protein